MGWVKTLVGILTVGASLLAVLAVAVFEGFLPASLAGNFTDTELGTFAAIAAVAAIALYAWDEA